MFTDLYNKKQGPVTYLTMTGKVQKTEKFLKQNLVEMIQRINVFRNQIDYDESTRGYNVLKDFHNFKRTSWEHLADFKVNFEKIQNKFKK